MSPVNIPDLESAMEKVKTLVLSGHSLQRATEDAASDWEISLDLLTRKVTESNWSEDGIRKTATSTTPRPIDDIVAERIAAALERKHGWQVQFKTFDGNIWTAIRSAGRGRVLAISHRDASWYHIQVASVKDPEIRGKLECW